MKKTILLISLILIMIPVNAQEVNYYLHDNASQICNGKLMDSSRPTSSYPAYVDLDEGAAIWCAPSFSKDTSLKGDVRVTLFIEAFFIKPDVIPLQFRFIKVTLVDVAPSGNIDPISSSRVTPLTFISNNTMNEHTFVINNVDYVIPAGHAIGIKVEKAIDLLSYFPFSLVAPFFATYVVYDSTDEKSFVEIPFNLTGGIDVECYNNEQSVKPGEEVDYGIIIYNNGKYEDEVTLNHNYAGGDWQVIIQPSTVKIAGNSFNYSTVVVKAPPDAEEGDYLNITVTGVGSNGISSTWMNTTVAPFEYGVTVTAKSNQKEGKPGDTINFTFSVKNTGDLRDDYNLSVTCAWNYHISQNKITLDSGESKDVSVAVDIPLNATNGTVQLIVLTAQSTNSDKESSAKSQLVVKYSATSEKKKSNIGEIIGLSLFIVFVVILLLIAAYLGKVAKKSVILSSEERMMEAPPGSHVEFSIKISNPLEKVKGGKNIVRYKMGVEGRIPENWNVKLDREELLLDGGEESEIKMHVDVPSDASIDEWASIDVIASPNKGKQERINFLVTLREPKPLLEINYEHEGEMREGERIVTKIRIENKGEADAEDKTVSVVVNGKEKNKITGLRIPAGSYVEVELPWIAEKENDIEVKIS